MLCNCRFLFTSHHKQEDLLLSAFKIHVFPKLKGKTIYQPNHFFFTDYLERAIDKFSAAAEKCDERVKSVDVSE